MSTKEKVLEFLEQHKGDNISGENIADSLNISRNAVWKAVNVLREDGYLLEASPKIGYRLLKENDKLSPQGISKFLINSGFYSITVLESVDSTNTLVKKAAEGGEAEGYVIVANEQMRGKGRMGRSFYSPSGTGIYFSILLRPSLPASEALYITTAASVAVAEAIQEIAGINLQIKWVNDLFFEGKKVCGILTEASIDFEGGGISYAVLGIGINLTDPKDNYPDELSKIAGSLFKNGPYPPDFKQKLIASLLDKFYDFYQDLPKKTFMEEYRRRSCVIGKEVTVISHDKSEAAYVIDVDNEAALVVKLKNGETKRLTSGEISIKVNNI